MNTLLILTWIIAVVFTSVYISIINEKKDLPSSLLRAGIYSAAVGLCSVIDIYNKTISIPYLLGFCLGSFLVYLLFDYLYRLINTKFCALFMTIIMLLYSFLHVYYT